MTTQTKAQLVVQLAELQAQCAAFVDRLDAMTQAHHAVCAERDALLVAQRPSRARTHTTSTYAQACARAREYAMRTGTTVRVGE